MRSTHGLLKVASKSLRAWCQSLLFSHAAMAQLKPGFTDTQKKKHKNNMLLGRYLMTALTLSRSWIFRHERYFLFLPPSDHWILIECLRITKPRHWFHWPSASHTSLAQGRKLIRTPEGHQATCPKTRIQRFRERILKSQKSRTTIIAETLKKYPRSNVTPNSLYPAWSSQPSGNREITEELRKQPQGW